MPATTSRRRRSCSASRTVRRKRSARRSSACGRCSRPAAPAKSASRATRAERLKFWAGRKAAFPAAGRLSADYYCMDGTIPRKRLGEMLKAIQGMETKYGLRCINVFHAGDGNMHPLILFDANVSGELDRAEEFGADILELSVALGGTITGARGRDREDQPDVQPVLGGRAHHLLQGQGGFRPGWPAQSRQGHTHPQPLCRIWQAARQERAVAPSGARALLSAVRCEPRNNKRTSIEMDGTIAGWVEQIRQAGAEGAALEIRGGGSKRFYGPGAAGRASRYARLQRGGRLRADRAGDHRRSGTPLDELEAVLAEKGQFLAFEPPHSAQRRLAAVSPQGCRGRDARPWVRRRIFCSACR